VTDTTFKPPPTLKTNVQTMDMVRDMLHSLHKSLRTWRRVSIHFNAKIPAGTLCSIAKGREPKKPEYRKILGLPEMKPAPVCAHCGKVPLKKNCNCRTNHRPRKQHYTVSLGYIENGIRDKYRELTPAQRRKAMDEYIERMED
jgi:hypothetical protein